MGIPADLKEVFIDFHMATLPSDVCYNVFSPCTVGQGCSEFSDFERNVFVNAGSLFEVVLGKSDTCG